MDAPLFRGMGRGVGYWRIQPSSTMGENSGFFLPAVTPFFPFSLYFFPPPLYSSFLGHKRGGGDHPFALHPISANGVGGQLRLFKQQP